MPSSVVIALILVCGVATLASPVLGTAQPPEKIARIGFLALGPAPAAGSAIWAAALPVP